MRYLTPVLTVSIALACAASAWAQGSGSGRATDQPAPAPTQGTTPAPAPTAAAEEAKFEHRRHVEFGLRYLAGVFPVGIAFDPTTEDYSDLWDTGSAFGFTAVFLENKVRLDNDRVVAGFGMFLNIDRFTFSGKTHTFASSNVLRPDDFEITSVVIGARLDLPSGNINAPVRFVGGIDVGIGFALMDSVDTQFDQTASGGGINSEGFYDDTLALMFEATLRFGAVFRINEKVEMNAQLLLGYNFMTAPDNGSSVILAPADAELMFNLYYGFQISVSIIIPKPEDAP